MGTLAPMALLPGVRPILVATPWVLVPKGVRPPATGQQSPVKGHPTTDRSSMGHVRSTTTTGHSPNGQEDISDRPGMPSVTGHSPTTGQVDETSSLPITGHRPSSHRSLDTERLNTGGIPEAPTTGMTGHRAADH